MTLLAFIIVLGVLVIVHEYGHFQVARWVGVRVETFSIGFGPELAAINRGDTTYRVALIPLGGYVKMAGDDPNDTDVNVPDGYLAQPVWKRAGIVLAGPVMNILLAFALGPVMYMAGIPEPEHLTAKPQLGWIVVDELRQSLQPGDLVLAVNNSPVETWRDLQNSLAINSGKITLKIARGDQVFEVVSQRDKPGELISILLPPMDTLIERILPDSAAGKAGVISGDKILAIDDRPIRHWLEIREALEAATTSSVVVVLERAGGVTASVQITPSFDENGKPMLGVARRESNVVKFYGPAAAVQLGTERVLEMFVLTFDVLKRLFTGGLGLDVLGGPLMIAQGAGDAARQGLGALITFMVFISVQLGILNLLPIPVLDGGHLLLLSIEAALGRRLPDKVVSILQYIGFGALMLLILYVTRNDIMRMWGDTISRWLSRW